jgi:transcriptional regulator with XRE-family HTH domain
MASTLEIRKKTGLSQQGLAEYLDVSRSLISMAERNLRDLPTTALLKLAEMEKVLAATDINSKAIHVEEEHKALEKLKDHHEKKVKDHLFKAELLQHRLEKMVIFRQQQETKLKLTADLAKKSLDKNKDRFEEHWLEYHNRKSSKKILQNVPALQMIMIEIERQLGYAAVHKKILSKLL